MPSIISFSSKNDLAEQLLSILSFLRYAGRPAKWTIYSDGTHTEEHVQFFKEHMPFVDVFKYDYHNPDLELRAEIEPYRKELLAYATSKFPLGKKLFCYLNHRIEHRSIFIDSDILFYEKAHEMHLLNVQGRGWSLPEWKWGTLDGSYLENNKKTMYQVNSGFFSADQNFEVGAGMAYLKQLDGNYHYFTEQTTFHIIFNDNEFWPLDPRTYYLNNSDQFKVSYNFDKADIVTRHYTSPVRFKMWQRDWKWHLSL